MSTPRDGDRTGARGPQEPERTPRARLLGGAAAAALLALLAAGSPAGAGRDPRSEAEPGDARARVKALVRRGLQVDRLIASGRLEVLEEYGAPAAGGAAPAVLVRGAQADLAAVEGTAEGRGRRRVQDRIHLRARTIQTEAGRRGRSSTPGAGGRLEIVQFHGPIKREWIEELRRGRARIVAYLPENAFIVWAEEPALLESARAPVQWREPLEARDRMSPDLPAEGRVEVTVQVAREGAHETLLEELQSRALEVIAEPARIGAVVNLRLAIPAEAIPDLAGRPEVVWIEPFERPVTHDERTALIAAGQVLQGRPLPPGYLPWLEAHGLEDLGSLVVEVTDTGVDAGGTQAAHPGLRGRIAYARDLTSEAALQDCPGHGTNVAGILGGGAATPVLDAEGYLGGLGVAPTVRIGSTRIFDCMGRFVPNLSFSDLIAGAYARGARIGNNSWGGQGGQYNAAAAEYDARVRDANGDPSDGDQGFLAVFSAGNAGPASFSVGWPATAKNVVSVGATEGFRPGIADGCSIPGIQADSSDHVLPFSSRGPTADGRIKPDLVAPGSHVVSLAAGGEGYTGSGVCDAYFPPGQRLLNWASGTSQAAPHVTGAAALAAILYRREFGADPSPAMLKAMLINHAHDIAQAGGVSSNTGKRPNMDQGWGRIDIGAVVEARGRAAVDQAIVFSATGDAARFGPLVVEDAAERAIVTLVWTDAPGSPAGWPWVNDLDLVVETGGVTYLGNVLAEGVSVPGGRRDVRNNVESVILPAGTISFDVTVEASNIAGDGIPSLPSDTDQDFALYVSNARLASSAGQIAFLTTQAACGAPLPVRVVDAGLRGLGRVSCVVESGGDRETVRLDESPAVSGAFTGAVDVASGAATPGDGLLQVQDLATITASYAEPDPETGAPVARSASVPARCAPPVASDVRVTRVGESEATIRWRTDRPADSRVNYGPGSSRSSTMSDARLVTDHAVRLTGLPLCSFHTATISSTDAAGLTGAGPEPPLRFSTGSGPAQRLVLFRDDMESLATRWTHGALGIGADTWELGFPGLGPPGAFSGQRAWGTNLDGPYGNGEDAVLTSPPIDLGEAVGPQLTFQQFFAITGGNPPISSNDGGWVEISTDGGMTWSPIDPVGGYPDSVDADNPHLPSGAGVFAGTQTGWSKATFDLSGFSGRVVRIRFHFWHDAAEQRATGAGWYLDDVEVTAQGRCHEGRLALDAEEYGCSSRAIITLADSDLNRNSQQAETSQVLVSSPRESLAVTLAETGASTGLFRGALQLGPAPAGGSLPVQEGDELTAQYQDADSGGGTPAVVTAAAVVPDCAPPPHPADVVLSSDGLSGRLTVSWTPVDPGETPDLQGYRVHYDGDGPGPIYGGTGALQGASPVRTETSPAALTLTALASCAPQYVTVTAFDRLGNESGFGPERAGMPPGSPPCSLGRLSLDGAERGCRDQVTVTLTDGDADPATVTGSVTVQAGSDSQSQLLPVVLAETAPASGYYLGSFMLSPSALPGAVQVKEGDTLTVTYADANDGLGGSGVTVASAAVVDCVGPFISQVRVTGRGQDRAVIRWTTDEPATSQVSYGPDQSLGLTASGPPGALTRQHEVPLAAGLASCSPVHFAVTSADAHANVTTEPGSGPPFYFGTDREPARFADTLEAGPGGWAHASLSGAPDEWELGPPVPGVTGGPSAAFSGSGVWGTDLDGPYETGADLVLVSPPIDLREVEAATLTFRHWYDIWEVNGFDDGAFVEISLDGGATWAYIVPSPATPYTTTIAQNAYTPLFADAYAGSSNGWQRADFLLDPYAGEVVRLRFHLVQDVIDPTFRGRAFAGWYLDDVIVTYAVACHEGRVELDRPAYGCSGTSARVRVADQDLDLDPGALDAAAALLTSGSEPQGEPIVLTETGPATGVFEALTPLSPADAPGTLRVGQGDEIVARYEDSDDGTGSARVAIASASVLDCTPPAISGVRVAHVGESSFRVEWTTSEPADSRVLFGADASLGQETALPGLVTQHAVTVAGLLPCTRYLFTVASADGLGNLARGDEAAPLGTVRTVVSAPLLLEDFEAGAPAWTHAGRGDQWTIAGEPGSRAAVAGAGGAYERPTGVEGADFVLVSPPFNLAGVADPVLTLAHDHDFASQAGGRDGGWVEAWDGLRWVVLEPLGGYPTALGIGGAGVPARGFGARGGGLALFDLSSLAGGTSRLRFRMFVRAGLAATGSGWRIDGVTVAGGLACRVGRIAFQEGAATCASSAASLLLADRDLDLSPAARDTATVTVSSSAGPAPLQVALDESAASAGTFAGEVFLSLDGSGGTLKIEPGATLTAVYLDEDDGSGQPQVARADLPVLDCGGPAIGSVAALAAHDSVLVRWKTDRPADSRATLSPESGPALGASDHRLVTSHQVHLDGAEACHSYTVSVSSRDAAGLTSTSTGPSGSLVVDTVQRRILFSDDMEGPDPGWSVSDTESPWMRGVPLAGPRAAFSGSRVFSPGLLGPYQVGTDAILSSPPVDLRGVAAPRLSFWHWYDVFGKAPPNSFDDGAWIEILPAGTSTPTWIEPMGGYTDVVDSLNGLPLRAGTPVYAGRSGDWVRGEVDLSAFSGQVVTIRFRLWQDSIDFPINGLTGAGWFLDDVQVWEPQFCFPAPAIATGSLPDLLQGGSATGVVVTGAGLRDGLSVSLGPGLTLSGLQVEPPERITFDLSAAPAAMVGARDLTIVNPDGQRAVAPEALRVLLEPRRTDIDGSGRVDAADLFLLARAFGSLAGEPSYAPAADLNADGVVDGLDLALLASRFGSRF